MLKKFQNSGIYGQAGGRFLKILEFLSITVFRGFQGLENAVFCEVQATKHCLLKFCEP